MLQFLISMTSKIPANFSIGGGRSPFHTLGLRILFILFLFIAGGFLFAGRVEAATYYVNQNGSGAQTGVDVDNAASIATFNAGTAPFNNLADNTVYLLDTVTTSVTIPNGGTSGHIATVRGDYPGHACTISNSNSSQLSTNGKSYVTVNGFSLVSSSSGASDSNILISSTISYVTLSNLTLNMTNNNGYPLKGQANNNDHITLDSISVIAGDSTKNGIYFFGSGNGNFTLTNIDSGPTYGTAFTTINGLTISTLTARRFTIYTSGSGIFQLSNISTSYVEGISLTSVVFGAGSYINSSTILNGLFTLTL